MTLCGSLGRAPSNQLYYLLCNHSIWHPIPSFAAVAELPAIEPRLHRHGLVGRLPHRTVQANLGSRSATRPTS